MSNAWTGYTDKIVKSGLTGAVIYGIQGGKWAASGSVSLTDKEALHIIGGWKDQNALRSSNAQVGGKKYIVLQILDNAIYAKEGTNGLCASKSAKCVIFGFFDKNLQAGKANMAVEQMSDYLRDNGY